MMKVKDQLKKRETKRIMGWDHSQNEPKEQSKNDDDDDDDNNREKDEDDDKINTSLTLKEVVEEE